MNHRVKDRENSDESLLREAAGGSHSALKELYDRYAGAVFAVSRRVLDRDQAEEVVQEVFLRVWRHAGRFDLKRGTVRVWLMGIARNYLLDSLRSNARKKKAFEAARTASELLAGERSEAVAPTEKLWQQERAARAAAALESLPQEQREALLLAYYTGLSHAEISRRKGWPLGTVKKRIRLGLTKLRCMLGNES